MRKSGLGDKHWSGEIHSEVAVPELKRDVFNFGEPVDACNVGEDVETTEFGDSSVHGGIHRVGIGDVAIGDSLGLGNVHPHDLGTFLSEELGGGFTNPSGCTCDEDSFPCKSHGRTLVSGDYVWLRPLSSGIGGVLEGGQLWVSLQHRINYFQS